jgi:drug/metabolite transporter (DMT)-like permease
LGAIGIGRRAEQQAGSGAAAAPNLALGVGAALATVLIWGGWVVTTRLGVTTSLAPADVCFLRYLVPALVLAPVLWRRGLAWDRLGLRGSLLLAAGAGAPFFLVAAAGMRFAPAAHVGALLPGTMPLFVALFSALFLGERLGRRRLAGFALILAGVAVIGGVGLVSDAASGAWRGHLLFLTAAAMWAGFTLALRRSGLGAWHAAALVSAYSLAGFAPVYLLALEPRLLAVPWPEVALQAGTQGVLSGLVALATYGIAVTRLGASRAAAIGALTPVVATLIAIPALGELPDAPTLAGIAGVSLGVVLASGVIRRPR